jgi:hypothetical protein
VFPLTLVIQKVVTIRVKQTQHQLLQELLEGALSVHLALFSLIRVAHQVQLVKLI